MVFVPLSIVTVSLRNALVTDPYFKHTSVIPPFQTTIEETGVISIATQIEPILINSRLAKLLALLKTGLRIPLYAFIYQEKPLHGSADEIIAQIHEIRFNPQRPYVITGSHYPDLYMRNMGVFFNALLDPRLDTTESDWQNRQRLALQTIAYDLAFIQQNQQAVTTIVPLGNNKFTGLNIYTPPSDSLFAILYSLKALTDPTHIYALFPIRVQDEACQNTRTEDPNTNCIREVVGYPLQTQSAAETLLSQHHSALTRAINNYLSTSLDPETHLVRQDIHLSSARDGVKRSSSFYDNVIAWATVQTADDLGIPHQETLSKEEWKQRILEAFWDEELGIFKDELHSDTHFSADSLIVTSTGFFDLSQEADKQKLARMLSYIENHHLDQPFPLKYTAQNNKDQMHPAVRYFAPSYMGDGIWSHWGMEYIKAQLVLAPENCRLATSAQAHLKKYQDNIEKYGGYPELYKANGDFFTSPLMKSVLHTGWVVNYEQAQVMAEHAECFSNS